MSTITETKLPSFVRVSRVEQILSDEPAFKDKISKKKEVDIPKRDGKIVHFSKEAVAVAQAMQNESIDPATCPKPEILKFATKILGYPGEAAPTPREDDDDGPVPKGPVTTSLDSNVWPDANPLLCVVNLLLGAAQMTAYDNKPGADKRRAALEQLEKDYSKAAGLS
jgi:hypothetical protein